MGIRRRLSSLFYPDSSVRRHAKHLGGKQGYILMYHEVLPAGSSIPAWTVVRLDEFEWQVGYLKHHFDIVSMNDAIARMSGGKKAKRPFVVVTFDDGYSGNLHNALPVMKANNAPFTVYVATQAIDEGTLYWYDQIINLMKSSEDVICSIEENGKERFFRIQANGKDDQCWKSVQSVLTRLKTLPQEVRYETALRIKKEYGHLTADLRMLTPDELRELSSDPLAEIGCHTHAHELLDQLENSEVHATLSKANELIEKWTGVCPRHFSYPNGNVNSRVRGLIKSTGFRSAVTTKSQHCSEYDNPFTLPRIGIGRFDSRSHFKAKLAGFL